MQTRNRRDVSELGRGAKAKTETQPVSGTHLMQHRIGVARFPECLKQLKEAVIAPRSDAPKVVRVTVSTRHKAKRLIPVYSRGSGDV